MRTFGLIGFPLSHSFSPVFFTKKFGKEGITETEYRLFELKEISHLMPLIEKTDSLCGLNVTIPYKEAVLPFMDELTPEATAIGAVNTIAIDRSCGRLRLTGHNTDAAGFRHLLHLHSFSTSTSALILGTGGAAKAVAFALQKQKITFEFVSHSQKDNSLCYSELTPEIINSHQLIVNATPLGMWPNVDTLPALPYAAITPKHLLIDLVYNPNETAFMKAGAKYGATVANGLDMLHAQAEASWTFWNKHLI